VRVVSWDGHNVNDGTDYTAALKGAPALPGVAAQWVGRSGRWPLISGVERPGLKLTLGVAIEGTDAVALRTQLQQWLDPEDETPKALVVEDDDGSDDRYVLALCEALQADPNGCGRIFVATLAVHGDARWRSTSDDVAVWSVTATGQTRVVTNGGQDDAYPRLTIEPTGSKTGSYNYKRFIPLRWRVDAAASSYPVDVGNDSFNTAALVTAGKMQSDGDDLRVMVDGVEVDRWLDGINTTTTKVWVNLSFQGKQEATLVSAIGAGDTVETLDVNEAVSGFPASGILMIDSEAFTYSGKNNALKRFTGVTRAAKGTTAAGHSGGATVWWCQREIWLLYGNAGASAPTVDDNYKPVFNLATSTNTSWDYDEFGENDGLRTGAWVSSEPVSEDHIWTANHEGEANPWEEMGLAAIEEMTAYWRLYNPCGITSANFQNGEKYKGTAINPWCTAQICSSGATWTVQYTIPSPTANFTWESWSWSGALASGATYVGLWLSSLDGSEGNVEVADVTLTLDSSHTPTLTIGAEQGNYSLACTLTNQTTGQAIALSYTMALNEELEVDSDAKTVIDLEDDSSQFQALTLVGGARRDWLPLRPGSNTLRFDDAGTSAVTVTVEWVKRYYS
jgi:hypothetical protein